MQKSKLLPGLAVGALALGVAGLSSTAAAAGHTNASSHIVVRGEDGGDDSGDDTASGGGGGGGGSGLPSTGSDTAPMLLLGAFALTAGGVTYRVASRRAHSA
jgi:LPXTG-motif cell wall-anchored protein